MGEKKDKKKKSEKAKKSKRSKDDADDDRKKKKKDKKEKKDKKKSKSRDDSVERVRSKDKLAKKKDKKDKKRDKKVEKKAKKEKKKKRDKKERKDRKRDKKDKKDHKKKKDKKDKRDKKDKKKKDKKEKRSSKAKVPDASVCCIDMEKRADVLSLCGHAFNVESVENLLHRPMKNVGDRDNHLIAPTLGRCPVCGTALRKYELLDINTKKPYYERKEGVGDTPIMGKIFRPKENGVNFGNFCFDEEKPYINFHDVIEADKTKWMMNDGSQVPEFKYFNDGYHWDEDTRSFHGSISWKPVTFKGAFQWDVILSFDREFVDIHVGLVHERKERILDRKEKIDAKKLARYHYPLDGKWKLIWLNADGNQQEGAITVQNNEFQQGPYLFNLNFSDPAKPTFRWPLDPVFATAKSGVNLKKKPMGPKVGENLVWETTHPAFAQITWERETIAEEEPEQTTHHFGLTGDPYTSAPPEEPKSESEGENIDSIPFEEGGAASKDAASTDDDGDSSDSDSGSDSDSDSGSDSDSSSSSGDSDTGWSDGSGNSSSDYDDDDGDKAGGDDGGDNGGDNGDGDGGDDKDDDDDDSSSSSGSSGSSGSSSDSDDSDSS